MNSHIHPCSLIKGEIIQRLRNRGALSEGRGKVIHCIRPGRKMPRRAVVRIQFAIMQEEEQRIDVTSRLKARRREFFFLCSNFFVRLPLLPPPTLSPFLHLFEPCVSRFLCHASSTRKVGIIIESYKREFVEKVPILSGTCYVLNRAFPDKSCRKKISPVYNSIVSE